MRDVLQKPQQPLVVYTPELDHPDGFLGVNELDVRLATLWCRHSGRVSFGFVRPSIPLVGGGVWFTITIAYGAPSLSALVVTLVLSLFAGLARTWLARCYADRFVRRRCCLQCGYPVTEASIGPRRRGRCPECGAAFDLQWYDDQARRRLLE